MKKFNIILFVLVFSLISLSAFGASFESRLQKSIKLQDANSVTNKANGNSIDSPYMDMMNDPMVNSMMQGGMNMLQNGMTGTFQQMEQAKQHMDYAKQQTQYIQQMDKEGD